MRSLTVVLTAVAVSLLIGITPGRAQAQIPSLPELLSRLENYDLQSRTKHAANPDPKQLEQIRLRVEASFRTANFRALLEAIAEADSLYAGRKWDDREKYLRSLSLEIDRAVVEPNEPVQASLIQLYPAELPKTSQQLAASFRIKPETGPGKLTILGERIPIGALSTVVTEKVRLPDGRYKVIAAISSGDEVLLEINKPLYAIRDFTDRIADLNARIAALKQHKSNAFLIATPEFKLNRLASFHKTGAVEGIDAISELDLIDSVITAISKGENPFENERGEIERAYRAGDGTLVPYRIYVPNGYSKASAAPLVILLHGALGDEQSYFSELYDPAVIKGEADKRGYLLAAPNARSRFSNYRGPAADDVFAVIGAVIRDYKVNPARIYLSGHSMGAFGLWSIAADHPDMFAAIAPVSGGSPVQPPELPALLEKIKSVPALIIHGARDGIVPPDRSKSIYQAAQKTGLQVTYLEIPNGDHVSVVASTFKTVLDFFDKHIKNAKEQGAGNR